jgi:hypothetical protein
MNNAAGAESSTTRASNVSILSRQALQGASFVDVQQLREAIDHFICAYNQQAAPFEWRQTEIKQQPLRDNLAYFYK